MRLIRRSAIAAFVLLLAPVLALAAATVWCIGPGLRPLGDLRGVALCFVMLVSVYGYAIAMHRLMLVIAPLREGAIFAGGRQEFRYQVYSLSYLFLFNSLIRCKAVPIPLMRLVYLALGARLGANTFSAGIIFDPTFVTIGANTLVGESAMLVPHVIEGGACAHLRIVIGDNVTIGAHAIVLAGAVIGDDAIVAANSVVAKRTLIQAGEMWGGSPARRLRAQSAAQRRLVPAPCVNVVPR